MSRQITLRDIILKIDLNLAHTITTTSKDDLRALFMATSGWPVIGSEGTFNEKIRTMVALKILIPINKSRHIYSLNWVEIDRLIVELEGAY